MDSVEVEEVGRRPLWWLRVGLAAVVALMSVQYFTKPQPWGLLDWADLPFHEAGHFILMPFCGHFMTALGGTLGQLAFPVGFAVYFFWRKRDPYAGLVCLFWISVNLVNISVYMRDARFMLLPTFGGDEHDWNFLFGQMSLLHKSVEIADRVRVLGNLLMAGSLVALAAWLWSTHPYRSARPPDTGA